MQGYLFLQLKRGSHQTFPFQLKGALVAGFSFMVSSTWSVYRQLITGKLVQVLQGFPLVSDTAIWAVHPCYQLVATKVRAFIDNFQVLWWSPLMGQKNRDSDSDSDSDIFSYGNPTDNGALCQ